MSLASILASITAERLRQDNKFGEQNHPDGTGLPIYQHSANRYRDAADRNAAAGVLSWRDVLLEEVHEALAESDPAALRAELVQVAAVAAAWIEAIDRRAPTAVEARVHAEHALPAAPAAAPSAPADRGTLYRELADEAAEWGGVITEQELRRKARQATAAVLPATVDRAAEWRAAADHIAAMRGYPSLMVPEEAVDELRRMADEAQQTAPWLSDSARIGRTLIWTWADIGKGVYGRGYRAAQTEARALLTGQRDSDEAQQPETQADGTDLPRITAAGDGVLLHLPEITYLDTQVWAADIGLTTGALRALRDAATAHLATGAQQSETRKACGCGQDGCEYCDVHDDADEERQPELTTTSTSWAGATELAPDRVITALAATGLVGYRQNSGRLLHCLAHKPAPASRYADFHEVTADNLDDGGICVHPDCGRDLLAPWPTAVSQPGKEA